MNESDYRNMHYGGSGVGLQGSRKPTALSLFPYIGHIQNKNVYSTANQERVIDIQKDPMGVAIDPKKNYKYNHQENELKSYKNDYLRAKNTLLTRSGLKAGNGV